MTPDQVAPIDGDHAFITSTDPESEGLAGFTESMGSFTGVTCVETAIAFLSSYTQGASDSLTWTKMSEIDEPADGSNVTWQATNSDSTPSPFGLQWSRSAFDLVRTESDFGDG